MTTQTPSQIKSDAKRRKTAHRRDYLREYQREYMREWRKQNPERRKRIVNRSQAKRKYNGKFWAVQAVNALLKCGFFKKPKQCERCGKPESKEYKNGLVAHHEDYSKPIDIVWICRKCHGARHREINDGSPIIHPEDSTYWSYKIRELVP